MNLEDNRYVLATDDSGRIVGIVARDRILQRLQSANETERSRWAGMPVGSLMNIVLSDGVGRPSSEFRPDLEAVAITENGGMIALAVEDDVFVSWERIEPMVTVAISDPLTGLINRMAYDRRLNEEWYRALRTGTSIGVMVVDLDRLKPINDTFGHLAGDSVLREVAMLLENSLRSYDILARYGGDEFVALCVGCGPGEMAIPIQRIQERVAERSFEFEGAALPVSVSIGAAVRHSEFADSEPASLFRSADDCLYRAKQSRGAAFMVELGDGFPAEPHSISVTDTVPSSLFAGEIK